MKLARLIVRQHEHFTMPITQISSVYHRKDSRRTVFCHPIAAAGEPRNDARTGPPRNDACDRSIQLGGIRGWSSPCIESRLLGGVDWATEDCSPAIVQVLQGADLRARHGKLLALPDHGKDRDS